MYFCTKCGKQLDSSAKFCSGCGEPVNPPVVHTTPVGEIRVPQEPPVYEPRPAYQSAPQVRYQQPAQVRYQQPEVVISTKTKVLGFVGMGLGIGALFFAVLGILYTLIGMEDGAVAFGMSVGFGMVSVPCGIVGMLLSNQSMDGGNRSKACSVGVKLSLAGLIVSGVMVFLGLIGLMIQ